MWRLALLGVAVLLVACSPNAGYVAPATTTPTSSTAISIDAIFEFPDVGYQITYPGSWTAGAFGPAGVLAARSEDVRAGLADDVEDLMVLYEFATIDAMGEFGIDDDSTADDLARLNVDFFALEPPSELTPTTIAGSPAVAFRSTDRFGNPVAVVQGKLGDHAYYLVLLAPDQASREAFTPTWEEMLASMRPVSPVTPAGR